MPHFSPISWLSTLLVFYLLLMMFLCILWWSQNYKFNANLEMNKSNKLMLSWKW